MCANHPSIRPSIHLGNLTRQMEHFLNDSSVTVKMPSSSAKTAAAATSTLVSSASTWLTVASGISFLFSSRALMGSLQRLLPGFVTRKLMCYGNYCNLKTE